MPNYDASATQTMMNVPHTVRQTTQTQGAGLPSILQSLNAMFQPHFIEGTVVGGRAGTYDAVVDIGNGKLISCISVIQVGDPVLGVSQTPIPTAGSSVLVYMAKPGLARGYILGVIPMNERTPPKGKPVPTFKPQWLYESGAGAATEQIHFEPYITHETRLSTPANAGRPVDMMPGAHILRNGDGVGLGINRAAATLMASPEASVRVSAIDDQVRIISGYFLHFNPTGVEQTFNDGGQISGESSITHHQCERTGFKDYGEPLIKDVGPDILQTADTNQWIPVERRIVPKKRAQIFTGHLGDLFHMFVAKPADDQPETEGKGRDKGVMHMHVDGNGRLAVQSANGISLRRWDRIPIPKRCFEPWDPKGDKQDEDGVWDQTMKKKLPWKPSEKYPYAHSLELRDATAWRESSDVQRIHEQTEQVGKKDFKLVDEKEAKPPEDKYDEICKAESDFKKNEYRNAFVNIEPDGAIIIRDAWGSEIAMRGGNIVITCAGQIELRPGGNIVVAAGDDAVIKARNSIDITATEHDVRLKAERNMAVVAGSDGNSKGGVLIESKGTGSGSWDTDGEARDSRGIVLKSADQMVATAKTLSLSGTSKIKIDTLAPATEDGGDLVDTGSIAISTAKLDMVAKRRIQLQAGNPEETDNKEQSALMLTKSGASIVTPHCSVVTQSGIGIFKGTQYAPLLWFDIGRDFYSMFAEPLSIMYKNYKKAGWLNPFAPKKREDLNSTFRTNTEDGTLDGTELYKAPNFYVYEAPWLHLKRNRHPLLPKGSVEKWREKAVGGTYPWPGDAGSNYVVLTQEVYILPDEGAVGIAKPRKEILSESGSKNSEMEVKSFHTDYEVLKR